MKKVVFICTILACLSFNIVSNAVVTNSDGYGNIKVYVLYDEENDDYQKEKEYLDENTDIRKEYINASENSELFAKIKDTLEIKKDDLPISIIGSAYFVGFDEKIQNNMEEAIDAYEKAEQYGDVVDKIKNDEDVEDIIEQNEEIYKQPKTSNAISKIIIAIIVIFIITIVIFIIKALLKRKMNR